MKRVNCAILAGAAAIMIAAGAPAGAVQNSDNRGSVQSWGSSGGGSSDESSISSTAQPQKKSTGRKSASGGSSNGGTTVPEPSNLLMLGLGLIGLIAGRWAARRRKKT